MGTAPACRLAPPPKKDSQPLSAHQRLVLQRSPRAGRRVELVRLSWRCKEGGGGSSVGCVMPAMRRRGECRKGRNAGWPQSTSRSRQTGQSHYAGRATPESFSFTAASSSGRSCSASSRVTNSRTWGGRRGRRRGRTLEGEQEGRGAGGRVRAKQESWQDAEQAAGRRFLRSRRPCRWLLPAKLRHTHTHLDIHKQTHTTHTRHVQYKRSPPGRLWPGRPRGCGPPARLSRVATQQRP